MKYKKAVMNHGHQFDSFKIRINPETLTIFHQKRKGITRIFPCRVFLIGSMKNGLLSKLMTSKQKELSSNRTKRILDDSL